MTTLDLPAAAAALPPFLSEDDLVGLTGLVQQAAQRRWLARNAVPFFVRADGRPAVQWADLRQGKTEDTRGFDLAALDRMG